MKRKGHLKLILENHLFAERKTFSNANIFVRKFTQLQIVQREAVFDVVFGRLKTQHFGHDRVFGPEGRLNEPGHVDLAEQGVVPVGHRPRSVHGRAVHLEFHAA